LFFHLLERFTNIIDMASSKVPLAVRITDMVHRGTVLGLVGICVVGIGSITFNIYANSDFAKMNKNKLAFLKEQYDQARTANAEEADK